MRDETKRNERRQRNATTVVMFLVMPRPILYGTVIASDRRCVTLFPYYHVRHIPPINPIHVIKCKSDRDVKVLVCMYVCVVAVIVETMDDNGNPPGVFCQTTFAHVCFSFVKFSSVVATQSSSFMNISCHAMRCHCMTFPTTLYCTVTSSTYTHSRGFLQAAKNSASGDPSST